jgi:CRISPR/Cas system-associated exonuclease Cas4 (RecB family)
MKALIAFIVMALGILTLIEINERRKAKKSKVESQKSKEDCPKEQSESETCSDCSLAEICEKNK